MSTTQPGGSSGSNEELYEWAYDSEEGRWVKVTRENSRGRRCGRCGCACPCTCADCLYQCCS